MMRQSFPAFHAASEDLEQRLQPRLRVEDYFARSGRTLRKSRSRLWFNETLKPKLIRAILRAATLYNRGERNALRVAVASIDLALPDLPQALEGFTILQISDLHIDQVDGLAEEVAAVVSPLKPDICVLTGDYRFEIRGDCSGVYPRLKKILDAVHARLGTYAILGNHDAAEIARWLQGEGVQMLVNDAVEIHTGATGGSFWLLGLDDPHDYRCADLPRAMGSIPSEARAKAFKTLLVHTPSLYREAAEAGVNLYLCGHTHAGQIRLPRIGALKKNGDFPREFVQGIWVYNAMHAYTSWGAGCSTLPVRFNCPPEVAMLRLKRQ
jgi:predicted MPP superfamily phosphohydrolase